MSQQNSFLERLISRLRRRTPRSLPLGTFDLAGTSSSGTVRTARGHHPGGRSRGAALVRVAPGGGPNSNPSALKDALAGRPGTRVEPNAQSSHPRARRGWVRRRDARESRRRSSRLRRPRASGAPSGRSRTRATARRPPSVGFVRRRDVGRIASFIAGETHVQTRKPPTPDGVYNAAGSTKLAAARACVASVTGALRERLAGDEC